MNSAQKPDERMRPLHRASRAARNALPRRGPAIVAIMATALLPLALSHATVPVPVQSLGSLNAGSCGDVTLAQCSDPEFLYETECGEQQRSRMDSECADLLFEAMQVESEERGTTLSIVAFEIDDDGVGEVVRSDRSNEVREYTPNLFSVHSQSAASAMVVGDEIAFNEYDQWLANGSNVNSCREYVWEKFGDLNEFYHATRTIWDDARAVYRVAYGPGSNRGAIGSRHVYSPDLRGRDGRVFGRMYSELSQYKRNGLYALNQYPGGVSDPPASEQVKMLDAIRSRSLRAASVLDRINSQRAQHGTVVRDWYWHYNASLKLSFEHNPPEEENNQIDINNLQGNVSQEPGPVINELGFADNGVIRRRLDAELDELQQFQRKLVELTRQWARANRRFPGTGWTVEGAGLEEEENSLDLIAIPPPQNPGFSESLAVPPVQAVPAPSPGGISNFAGIDAETVVRKRILDEMIEVILYLDSQQCSAPGLTPCDWSPRFLVDDLRNRFGDEQDQAYEWCNDFTGGNLQNVLNLDITFVEAEDHPEFNCKVTTGNSITAAQLEGLENQVADCRQAQIDLAEQREVDAALNRVKEIEELVDPSTGDIQAPGIERSGGEVLGNEYFGCGYEWGFGFISGINADICQIVIEAGGNAKAWASVFLNEVILVDALANVNTLTREVDLYAKVISKNIFTPRDLFEPVDIDVPEIEPLDFSISTDLSTSQRVQVFKTVIVFVVVPVSVAAGVAGNVGAEFGLDVYANPADNNGCPSASIDGRIEPYAGVDGYIEAGIDILIASAGIRGNLNIITASVPFTAGLGVEVLSLSLDPADYQLTVNTALDLEISTLSGSIQGYASLGPCPFCLTGEFDFVSWPGVTFERNIFDHEYVVNMDDLFVALGL